MVDPLALRTDAGQPVAWDVPRPFVHLATAGAEDCDQQRHVNNAVYPRWMDEVALAHSVAVGYDWRQYEAMGATFVVLRHEIDYRGEAVAGDRLALATWPEEMDRFRARRRHQIVRLRDGVTVVRAVTHWVYIDIATRRPQRIPPELIAAFHASVQV